YLPATGVIIRLSENGNLGDLLAVAAGALSVGCQPQISSAVSLSRQVAEFLGSVPVTIESDAVFEQYMSGHRTTADGLRVRLLGGDAASLANAVQGSVDVAIYSEPLTASGRVELLPFVFEQAVSATNHRFGNPTKLLEGVL
ncbi:MAG: 1-pyrroline-5-carboxylate dehydrogenase, partial [Ancrocorticia populi]